jgi:hypothetical protein
MSAYQEQVLLEIHQTYYVTCGNRYIMFFPVYEEETETQRSERSWFVVGLGIELTSSEVTIMLCCFSWDTKWCRPSPGGVHPDSLCSPWTPSCPGAWDRIPGFASHQLGALSKFSSSLPKLQSRDHKPRITEQFWGLSETTPGETLSVMPGSLLVLSSPSFSLWNDNQCPYESK